MNRFSQLKKGGDLQFENNLLSVFPHNFLLDVLSSMILFSKPAARRVDLFKFKRNLTSHF